MHVWYHSVFVDRGSLQRTAISDKYL